MAQALETLPKAAAASPFPVALSFPEASFPVVPSATSASEMPESARVLLNPMHVAGPLSKRRPAALAMQRTGTATAP